MGHLLFYGMNDVAAPRIGIHPVAAPRWGALISGNARAVPRIEQRIVETPGRASKVTNALMPECKMAVICTSGSSVTMQVRGDSDCRLKMPGVFRSHAGAWERGCYFSNQFPYLFLRYNPNLSANSTVFAMISSGRPSGLPS